VWVFLRDRNDEERETVIKGHCFRRPFIARSRDAALAERADGGVGAAAAAGSPGAPALRARIDFGSEVHISQEQLGVFVRAARESVNRQLQRLRKDGILDLQRGRILLLNMSRLTAVARNE
jgi:CRP-like cAMP-binding protein